MTTEDIDKAIESIHDLDELIKVLFKDDVSGYGKPRKLIYKIKAIYDKGVIDGFLDGISK